jgi:hypothetical protein
MPQEGRKWRAFLLKTCQLEASKSLPQQATDNFPNNQRPDQPILLRRFEEAHEAHARIK